MTARPHLVLMLKEPRPGRVKTRLGREIGMVAAARWYRRQALATIRRLDDPRWQLVLAVSPDREGFASRIWPAYLPRVAQGTGDLGARMARLLRRFRPGAVAVVGSDIPSLGAAHIARAFARLGGCDAVFGPAADGGFWLVALKPTAAPPPGLFAGVRWSGPEALGDSVATLPGWRIGLADTLDDVDTADDLRRAAAGGHPALSA